MAGAAVGNPRSREGAGAGVGGTLSVSWLDRLATQPAGNIFRYGVVASRGSPRCLNRNGA